jgi:hypothetical protein
MEVLTENIYFIFFSPMIISGSFCDKISHVSGIFKDTVNGSEKVFELSTSNIKLKYEPGDILFGVFIKFTLMPLCATHKIELNINTSM